MKYKRNILALFFMIPTIAAFAEQYEYKGSNSIEKGSMPGGFWHSGLIGHFQIGWDNRIYIYFENEHRCGSNLVFYEPTAGGRQMVFETVIFMEHYQRKINVRIDRCVSNENGVTYGFFDKLETFPREDLR